MDLFEAVKNRHSYRGDFEDKKVSPEDLQRIVQTGIQAPSGMNAQTTSFIIVDDEDLIKETRKIITNNAIKTAPALIIVLSDDKPVYNGMSFQKEDYSAAVENMLLAITALGYASVWIDGALRRDQKAERIATLLDVPDKLTVSVVLPVGLPKETKEQKEKLSFNQRAWFNGYKK